MTTSSEPRGRRPVIVGATLLVAYTAVVVWTFVAQSHAWPRTGSWADLLFFLFCPGIVFQTVNLISRWRTGRGMSRPFLLRALTVPAGLVLAVGLAARASDWAMSNFTRAYAPLVAEIGAHLAEPCGLSARYFAIPAVVAYNRRAEVERPLGKLSYDRTRFVLSFGGGSFDMDGSTIHYDSAVMKWGKFHNDHRASADEHAHRIEGLAACKLGEAE
jgi:hypothetical protein